VIASLALGAPRALNDFSASRYAGQPTPGPVEPAWLHTAGQIAGVALMIELLVALLIVAALMFGLAYGMWWVSRNVVPVIGEYSELGRHYIAIAERGSDRVAHGVASFHGARAGIAAGLRAFFLPGRGAPRHPTSTTQPLRRAAPATAPDGGGAPRRMAGESAPAPNPTPAPAPQPVSTTHAMVTPPAPNPTPAPSANPMTTPPRATRPAAPLIAATPRVAGRALGVVAGRVAGS
jgi:hypothetical protein